MKKKLVIVLAVVLTLTLLLTSVAFADVGHKKVETIWFWGSPIGQKVSNWLDMSYYWGGVCSLCSGTSIGQYYRVFLDRDRNYEAVTIEDFEWGSNGINLDEGCPRGEVDWEVGIVSGNSVAEIDTDTDQPNSGTSCARFYRDGSECSCAYYPLLQPCYISFYLKKDDTANALIRNGDGFNEIYVRINEAQQLEYRDSDEEYQPVCTLSAGTWYQIEFRNIDWTDGTYDIRVYLNGLKIADMGATMFPSPGCNKEISFGSYTGSGEFWIDDIVTKGDIKADYPNLPDDDDMYDRLEKYMDTSNNHVAPSNYGPGFVEMALHYGYDNFSYVPYDTVTVNDYQDIVNAIDNGWPVALTAKGLFSGFSGVDAIDTDGETEGENAWPCEVRHWIAIKGYSYCESFLVPGYTYERRIRCTDSYSEANNLWLDWDELVTTVGEDWLEAVIIKDDDPENDGYVEDFEWGNDGDSLEYWQENGGEVDWYVYNYGDSIVEIDATTQAHTGTKSARIYRSSNLVYANYELLKPSYIGFWVRKDDTAYADFRIGDGNNLIRVRINDEERIEYVGSDGEYHNVPNYWLSINNWRLIEFKNIDWGTGTYDIYVKGYYKTTATMSSGTGYKGKLHFGSYTGSGEFWIDDITDSLANPEATTLELLPETGNNPVDTTHDLTATVYDQFGCEMEDVVVTWKITGMGTFSGTLECVTDTYGQADAEITSSVPGTSTVTCGVTGKPSIYDTATNDWTYIPDPTTVELLPETDTNPVDTTHDLTATVYDQFGYVMEGMAVNWNISGVGAFSGTPEGVTDADGQANAVITSSEPGTSTVRCEVTGNPSVFDTATKDWTYTPEATTVELLPETDTNPVDTTHNLTATVYDQFGYEMEGVAVTWSVSGVGSFSGTPESQTDASGQADAVITSSVLGTSTVRCEVTGNPSVFDTATKDWTYLEDFEWGNDGDSLGMDGGNIDWTVEADGSSVAEIDTAQAHSGTRSGRFYYDGSSENILAYYSQDSPTWRGFYLMKDKNAVPYTITGDGTNTVFIRVTKNEWVQYYDGSWQSVCKISDSTWHFIEFRNIDWVAATYDIYVDGNLENSGTPMSASTSYNGITAYYGGDYESEFWIDDILK